MGYWTYIEHLNSPGIIVGFEPLGAIALANSRKFASRIFPARSIWIVSSFNQVGAIVGSAEQTLYSLP